LLRQKEVKLGQQYTCRTSERQLSCGDGRCPFDARAPETFGRWLTLLDMIQFMAWELALAMGKLHDFRDSALSHCTFQGNRDAILPLTEAQSLSEYLRYARKRFADIELGQAVLQLTDNFIGVLGTGRATYDNVMNSCHFLIEAVESELKFRRFAYVPVDRAHKLDNIDHDWADTQTAFPQAKDDVRDAIECYALDKHTACIFHLMRVSEHGLRKLARRLKVSLTDKGQKQPLEYADWDKVITGIKQKIGSVRSLAKGPKRERQLRLWSEAADHCEYMKDNWRNAVSHTRKPYGSTEALLASERVHAFMNFLARSLK
jgi:hypothetical protein